MAIDLSILADWLADQISELPTEAEFRGNVISVRLGEAPQARSFALVGVQIGQQAECLIHRDDADPAPAGGEVLTIGGRGYKVLTVTPLASLSDPAGYRLTLSLYQ